MVLEKEGNLMIRLSNGHCFEYMIASGAMAFGKGWLWDKPLIWLGLMKPELFTVVIKTLTLNPRKGNLQWWNPLTWFPLSPWACVKLIPGGSVNKVGLSNKGINWWCDKIAPKLDFKRIKYVGSIYGTADELVTMAKRLNKIPLVAIEVNPSCPNTGHNLQTADLVVHSVVAVAQVSRHPVIVKVSADQDYPSIVESLQGVAEAVSINSVPWKTVFPSSVTPLSALEKKVGGGGGGVSGKPAQLHNWNVIEVLAAQRSLPVIASSVMEFEDMRKVRNLGASAISFGAIHLATIGKPWTLFTNPCKPTKFVQKERKLRE